MDAIAKVESYEKKVRYEARNNTQGRVISTGHRPQGRSFQPTQVNTGSVQRKFPHNQRRPLLNFANQGQNSNQNAANNQNQNFGANQNQRTRQPLRWQHDPEFLERARKLGLCFRCGEQGHKTFERPNKHIDRAVVARMEAHMNEMDTTLEEASDAGKYSDFSMKCMTTSVHHLKASVIRILGKIGYQKM